MTLQQSRDAFLSEHDFLLNLGMSKTAIYICGCLYKNRLILVQCHDSITIHAYVRKDFADFIYNSRLFEYQMDQSKYNIDKNSLLTIISLLKFSSPLLFVVQENRDYNSCSESHFLQFIET